MPSYPYDVHRFLTDEDYDDIRNIDSMDEVTSLATTTTTSVFTNEQWKSIVWTTRFSSLLSIIGSSIIIIMIVRGGKEKMARIHNRILLSMSISDLVNTVAMGMATAPSPREYKHIYGAVGSQLTCSMQGFFMTIGFLTMSIYNAFLCIYYLAVIKYNIKDEVLASYQLIMHIIAISLPLAYAIVATCMDAFHPYFDGSCAISDGCLHASDETQCVTNSASTISSFSYIGAGIIGIVWITINFCMISIYLSVRKQQQAMKKYQTFRRRSSTVTTATNHTFTTIRRWKQKEKDRNSTLEEALVQSSLYVLSYFFSIFWVVVADAVGEVTSGTMDKQLPKHYSWLVILATFFTPLQGFFNCLAYLRPRFLEVWKKRKGRTFMWALITTLLDRPVEEEKELMKQNRQYDTSKRLLNLKIKLSKGEQKNQHTDDDGDGGDNDVEAAPIDRHGNRRFSLPNVMVSSPIEGGNNKNGNNLSLDIHTNSETPILREDSPRYGTLQYVEEATPEKPSALYEMSNMSHAFSQDDDDGWKNHVDTSPLSSNSL